MGGNKISASGVSEEGKKERRNKKKEVKGKDVKMARREKRKSLQSISSVALLSPAC